MQLFAELAPDDDSIPIEYINQLYVRLARLSNQRMENPKEKEYQQQMEEEEKNKRLAKLGFDRLLMYVNGKSSIVPNQIFSDCDLDGSGDIDKSELNKFLIASEIEEFRDKTIRRLIINDIFSRFSSSKIKKDDFFKLLQIPKEKLAKKPNPPPSKTSKRNVANPE
jgi:DNA-binding PucR family transcriptional regulator